MLGTYRIALFSVLTLLGSAAAAPACQPDSETTSTRTRRPHRTSKTSTARTSTSPAASTTPTKSVVPTLPTETVVSTASASAAATTSSSTAPALPTATGSAGAVDLGSTFLYDLDQVGLKTPSITSSSGTMVDAGVYIVDMAGHTKEQITAYKDAGKTVICYFSAGTMEPLRTDATAFDPECVCGPGGSLDADNECTSGDSKMPDWDEYWLDIHSAKCKANVQEVQLARIQSAYEKGCDGMDPDNVDSYSNGAPHGNTEADQVEYLLWLAETIHNNRMIVDLKNSGDLIQGTSGPELVKAFDFSVIESCYNVCDSYDPFLDAGKPQIQIEYQNLITTCPDANSDQKLKSGQNLAVYSGKVLDSRSITLWCPNPDAKA